jgi:predicted  nucleic acid-binding Zn-ribbon protein
MKNSIEEDIKNAEHFIKSIKTDKEYKEENGWHGYYNKEIVELARILQHILSDYKRILKENEELKKFHIQDNKHLDFIMQHSIPVQKVKDKIEELQKEYNKLDKQVDEYIKSVEKDVSTYYENKERISIMQTLSYFIDTLQELLEGRK